MRKGPPLTTLPKPFCEKRFVWGVFFSRGEAIFDLIYFAHFTLICHLERSRNPRSVEIYRNVRGLAVRQGSYETIIARFPNNK